MELAEIQDKAFTLSERDRAALAAALLETLAIDPSEATDHEVDQREAELDSGKVQPISHDEFLSGVRRDRGR